MTALVMGCCLLVSIIALALRWGPAASIRPARRRRWMRTHPAPTFVFADLTGYTALTEHRGDQAAALVARAFTDEMRAASRRYGAWHVKSLGDGVMIWASDAAAAIALAAHAVNELGRRPDLLPVRAGVHTGPAVMHGFDWYGSAVNLAARLAGEARPGEALISATSLSAARGRLIRAPRTRRVLALRGVERPVVAWQLN